MRRAFLVGVGVLISLLPLVCQADGQTTSERAQKTTRVVTNKDGSTATTVTVVHTGPDGQTSTSTTTTTTFPDSPALQAPPEPPLPPPSPQVPGKQAPIALGSPMIAEALAAHNNERKKVGATPLLWDPALSKLATEWSMHLCGQGKQARPLQHRPFRQGGPGENLWQGALTSGQAFPITEALNSWASERRFFDPRSGRCKGGECGHYTQVVWRTTTHVGCGVATCPSRGFSATVWTCNYAPAGNVMGQRP